jgi:predicted DNA-binding transcriptional regulator AlpA
MEPRTAREPLLNATEVAAMLGIPPSTLANWRYQGLGPRYLRVGRHVRYLAEDLDDWIRTQRVRHP